MKLPEILSHDLLQSSPIFDGDLPAKADKSKLLEDIQPHLSENKWSPSSNFKTHVSLDFMPKMKQMILSHFSTFSDVIHQIISSAKRICTNELLHVVLDSYC